MVGKRYPWGDEIDESKANYGKSWQSDLLTSRVGSYAPNGYGLYDMAGNVWEWCLDGYDGGFYANSPKNNPIAGGDISIIISNFTNVETARVLRGGSWDFDPSFLRVADRDNDRPTNAFLNIGCRCAGSGSVSP